MKKLNELIGVGRLVGSRGAAFRRTSTSKPDDWKDHSGKDVGAMRNFAHEKAAVEKAEAAKREREAKVKERNKRAAQRAKETLRMAKESAEPTGTEARVKIKNVARPDDEAPTSEKSKLSKQAEIKTKIIEEKPPMRKIDFGLPANLIDATRSILEKKTQVDLEPETDDKEDNGENDDDDNDDEVKKESKHTSPKSEKEKKLAALAHPKDKITHKDVLVGRGVLKKEETEIEEKTLYGTPDEHKRKLDRLAKKEKALPPGISPARKALAIQKQKLMSSMKKEEIEQIDETYTLKHTKTTNPKDVTDDEDQPVKATEKHYDIHSGGKKVGQIVHHHNDYGGHFFHATLHGKKVPFDRQKDGAQTAKAFIDGIAKTKWHAKNIKETVDIDSMTEEQLDEVLKKTDPAGKWISDFVHSKDPKFAGKSAAERKRMALGAYYAKQRNEEVEQIDELEKSKYVDMVYKATDPSYGRGADHIIKRAGREHGAKFAKDLEGIADKGHFPRRGHSSGRDPLKPYPGDTGPRITKAGKMHSTDARVMKGKISSRLGQHTKPNLPESEQIEFAFTNEEIERLEAIATQFEERKPTIVSAPIRGANQDQSGFGVKNNVADYTISDSKKTKLKEESELEEGRGRPKKSGEEAEGDDTAKHPIQQLHKIAASIQGNEPHFEHKDGSKTKVSKQLAKHITAVYGSMRTTQEKDDFANKLHANRDSMMSAVDKHVR